MWASITLFLLKAVWNVGVPYAMIWEAVRNPRKRHGWSIFVLLDVVLLVVATVTSVIASQEGIVSPSRILLYGASAILASYLHIAIVLLVGGYILGLFPHGNQGNHLQPGHEEEP
jgi:hypothetical protein